MEKFTIFGLAKRSFVYLHHMLVWEETLVDYQAFCLLGLRSWYSIREWNCLCIFFFKYHSIFCHKTGYLHLNTGEKCCFVYFKKPNKAKLLVRIIQTFLEKKLVWVFFVPTKVQNCKLTEGKLSLNLSFYIFFWLIFYWFLWE